MVDSGSTGGNETEFEIVRETREGSSALSRYAVNIQTKNVAYYCKVDARQVSIHRGDESGQVMATTESFQGKDGITEIQLTHVEATVPIRHKHHTLPFMHGYTAFRVEGKQYQWKKHRELIDESNGKRLATFKPNSDKKSDKLGRLTITSDGQEMTDLIVITCLIDQERGDEGKWTRPEEAIQGGGNKS